MTAQLVLNCDSDNAEIFDVSDGFDVNTLPPVPKSRDLTSEECNYLRALMDAVKRPTKYMTPKGEVTINYDSDLAQYIMNKSGAR